MREEFGDLWEMEADARCITTNGFVKKNGCLVMGAGVAGQAEARYPKLPKYWGQLVLREGNKIFAYQKNNWDPLLLSFPVKHVWWEEADLALIETSARELMALIERWELKNVLLPRPGCGNGRLNWDDVKPVIEPILDDRVIIITK